jgi:hypothetical protein
LDYFSLYCVNIAPLILNDLSLYDLWLGVDFYDVDLIALHLSLSLLSVLIGAYLLGLLFLADNVPLTILNHPTLCYYFYLILYN